MVGPTGAGVLIGRKSLLEDMNPFMGGGEMINMVELENLRGMRFLGNLKQEHLILLK